MTDEELKRLEAIDTTVRDYDDSDSMRSKTGLVAALVEIRRLRAENAIRETLEAQIRGNDEPDEFGD